MDLDNIQQNMNTRVVFKEPRGMIRWLQLFFAIIAFSTIVDFHTEVKVEITCPPATTPSPAPAPPAPAPVPAPQIHNTTGLVVQYPFDFANQVVKNPCPGSNYTYAHLSGLTGSPQFFVMTGVLSLIYASASLTIYLFFSSTYDSIPVMPLADLIITAILCLFWFIASWSFSSGVTLLKSTAKYDNIRQTICPDQFISQGGACSEGTTVADFVSLSVGLIAGFMSIFLWGTGLWFVYKETHFHTPREQLGSR